MTYARPVRASTNPGNVNSKKLSAVFPESSSTCDTSKFVPEPTSVVMPPTTAIKLRGIKSFEAGT